MQKGKLTRWVQPYTVSVNWAGDTHAPARVHIFTSWHYGNVEFADVFTPPSEKYTLDRGNLQLQWVAGYSLPFFDFGLRLRITPQLDARYQLVNLFVTDFFGSTMDVGYAVNPDTFGWSYAGDYIPTAPAFIHTTGLFEDILFLNLQAVTYREEP